MNTNDIILSIDAEISRLQQAKALLAQASSPTPASANLAARPLHLQKAKQPASIRQTSKPGPQSAER
jgi:hypothetical protein